MSQEAKLVIDHVVAVALGGTDDAENLVTACVDCNAGKSSVAADEEFVQQVDVDTARFMRAMAAAVKLRQEAIAKHEADIAALEDKWRSYTYVDTKEPIPLPADWRNGALGYLLSGLPVEEMLRLVDVAMAARTKTYLDHPEWRYFLGCCKNVLHEIEATARKLLETKAVESAPEVTDASATEACLACDARTEIDDAGLCSTCAASAAEWEREQEKLDFARRHPEMIEPRLADLP